MKQTAFIIYFSLIAIVFSQTTLVIADDQHDSSIYIQEGLHHIEGKRNHGEGSKSIPEHNSITSYDGPTTCITCHTKEAYNALNSVHMQWNGFTPDLVNTDGEPLGKANLGINTFCTYAMSSESVCFSCHVRADGNAPHPPVVDDVDCLMCHSETYQRKFVLDPDKTITVPTIDGDKTYQMIEVDAEGNYLTAPDFDKMPPGTEMVDIARNVHMPTRLTCLRCHASAGGGDWTKRGDMGWSSAAPTVMEDVHLSPDGADLHCVNCHWSADHKISGRGIDLRQTEIPKPTCQDCHSDAPHGRSDLNRHAQGQVSCQVCHIRTYAKGGATEISRDWREPHYSPTLCFGQGGYVGHEIKESFVQPEYVWFNGTSYVYNIGETITADQDVYHMAKAIGSPFDSVSKIFPIKRHWSYMPLHTDTNMMVPPVIMWMFMTGNFDLAVKQGMDEWNMEGTYDVVPADAEMLITHGVEPSSQAPGCRECHDNSGHTPDGYGILPFTQLGYHNLPASVTACSLCHEPKNLTWRSTHKVHRKELSCTSCHTDSPTGFVEDLSTLCLKCHDEDDGWEDESHKKHLEEGIACDNCHTFD